MRKLIFCLILAIAVLPVSAQYKETFDSNSLGWTVCIPEPDRYGRYRPWGNDR